MHSRRAIVARARPSVLEVTAEQLDVGPARTEQRDRTICAPLHVLPQIERVGLSGQAAVASEEPDERGLLRACEHFLAPRERRRCRRDLHRDLQSTGRNRDPDGSRSDTAKLKGRPYGARNNTPERALCAAIAVSVRSPTTGVGRGKNVPSWRGMGSTKRRRDSIPRSRMSSERGATPGTGRLQWTAKG